MWKIKLLPSSRMHFNSLQLYHFALSALGGGNAYFPLPLTPISYEMAYNEPAFYCFYRSKQFCATIEICYRYCN